jgi:hypothetical protein
MLCFCSCKTPTITNNEPQPVVYEYSVMKYTLNRIFTVTQVDSMINADKLSPLNKWIKSEISYQGKSTKQYLFIKSLKKDGELIYTITDLHNNTYKCTKRITEDK